MEHFSRGTVLLSFQKQTNTNRDENVLGLTKDGSATPKIMCFLKEREKQRYPETPARKFLVLVDQEGQDRASARSKNMTNLIASLLFKGLFW